MQKLWLPAVAVLLSFSPAVAEEARKWMGETQEAGAVLLYGLPESDDVPVSFRCELPLHEFVMTLSLEPDFEPKSGPVKVTLTAPPAADELIVDGQVQFLEEMGVTFVEARPVFDAAFARLLKQGGELKFTIGDASFAYPLAGAADAMGPIEAACAKPT